MRDFRNARNTHFQCGPAGHPDCATLSLAAPARHLVAPEEYQAQNEAYQAQNSDETTMIPRPRRSRRAHPILRAFLRVVWKPADLSLSSLRRGAAGWGGGLSCRSGSGQQFD